MNTITEHIKKQMQYKNYTRKDLLNRLQEEFKDSTRLTNINSIQNYTLENRIKSTQTIQQILDILDIKLITQQELDRLHALEAELLQLKKDINILVNV